MRTPWWIAAAVLAVAAGCGDRAPLPIEPAWTSCAVEASRPPDTDLPRLDDSFQPVSAVICGHPSFGGRGTVSAVDEHRVTDVTALVAALRLPDEPRTADACTLVLHSPPFIALVDQQGRWVRPGLPANACGQVRQEVRDALAGLPPAPTATAPSTEDESAAAGCTRQWADMVGATASTTPTGEPAVIPAGFDGPVPVRRCVYRVPADQQGTGKPAGDFLAGRYLSDEQWATARRDIEAAARAGPCTTPASRFAVLHLATGQIHVELDGCRRLLAQAADGRGTVRQAVPSLVDLLR